jgi:putative nucleotidyltransferase with HDIG domain
MSAITLLEEKVKALYEAKDPDRADWADWMYGNHVLWVADKTEELTRQFGANPELARAAALLHDIADAKMNRHLETHAEESLKLAHKLLIESGFVDEDIQLIVEDAIRYHSCHGNERPKSLEGQCLATADATSHFQTNFYPFAFHEMKDKTLSEVNAWALEKIERDFNQKILFDEIKDEVRPQFETLQLLFGGKT